jgi:hypothetical protein
MTWVEASCDFWGEAFSPSFAEERTGLHFAEKNEAGEIGTLGRYKGVPIPYGSSTLLPPCQVTIENPVYGLEWLAQAVKQHRQSFEKAGATRIVLDLNVSHDGQCNLEFGGGLLRKIAESGVTLTVSCYENAEYVERKLQKARREGSG